MEAVVALAQALDASFDPVACMFTTKDRPGLPSADGEVRAEAPIEAVTDEHLPEPSAVRSLVEAEVPVVVTSLQGLLRGHDVEGTRVRP